MSTNWANRTKAKLDAVKTNTTTINDGYKSITLSNSPVVAYYRFNEVPDGAERARQLVEGATFTGTYEGSFENKFGGSNHKIATDEGLIVLPSAAQLNKLLEKAVVGTGVIISYSGKKAIKSGKYEGKIAHEFTVRAQELKN